MKNLLLSVAIFCLSSTTAFAQETTPAKVLDLSGWRLSLPVDATGSGKATTLDEKAIADGYVDSKNFYVNEAGDGVVFSSPIKGVLTSKSTTYTRSIIT